MILIRKGSCPQSWRTFARTPGAAFTSAPKDDLRASLIREQGYICAYCMKRIDLGIDVNGENKTRIEHIKAESKSLRENHPEETLDYSNMVLCCNGESSGQRHCDLNRRDRDLHLSPLNSVDMKNIRYSSGDGTIKSSDPSADNDLNNVLNLNNSVLKANRLEVLKVMINKMSEGRWNRSRMQTILAEYEKFDDSGCKHSFCGIVVWFLRKRLQRQ